MSRKVFLSVCLAVCLVAILIQPLTAALLIRLSTSELISNASKIVVGEILDTRSRWTVNKWGDELIYTDVAVRVDESLKGAPSEVVTFAVEGGQIGEIGLTATHMPTFSKGERVVLFLAKNPDFEDPAEVTVYGGVQGKWVVDESGYISRRNISVDDLKSQIEQIEK